MPDIYEDEEARKPDRLVRGDGSSAERRSVARGRG
jgi:hypothetical protein